MDDDFLSTLRAEPSAEFTQRLRTRLARQDAPVPRADRRPLIWRAGAGVAAAVVLGVLFMFPTVRASAQAFLDLFRVSHFTAVPVNPRQVRRLFSDDVGLQQLIGERVERLGTPAPSQEFASIEQAGEAAGIQVRVPQVLPDGLVAAVISAEEERVLRVTGDATRLQQLLETLDIRDLRVPETLDGQTATLRVPAMVRIIYGNGDVTMNFTQGRSPEVTLPGGVDLPQLGEIGLRILGLERGEAYRLAHAIDWRTTLVVPVAADTTAFRQVDVQGHRALLMRTVSIRDGHEEASNILVWSDSGIVYAMSGRVGMYLMLQMANSLR
jgi:hypothetical protein